MGYKNYKIIKTEAELDFIIASCKSTRYCSFDFETNAQGYQYEDFFTTILGISFQPGSAYIICMDHEEPGEYKFPLSSEEVLRKLSKELFQDPEVVKIAYNAKFEHKILKRYFTEMKGRVFDVMLMKYLLDEERPNDLKSLVKRLLPEHTEYEDEVKNLVKKHGWSRVPIEILSQYCALDCDLTLRLCIILEPKLQENGFYQLFRNLLMMCHRFYAEAEFHGMYIHRLYLENVREYYGEEIERLKTALLEMPVLRKYESIAKKEHIQKLIDGQMAEIEVIQRELDDAEDPKVIASCQRKLKTREAKITKYLEGELTTKKEVWNGVNLGSPKQLIEFFYTHPEGFNWDIVETTDSGNPSTGEETLINTQHRLRLEAKDAKKKKRKKLEAQVEFLDNLFSYRGKTKLYSTYVVGILDKLTVKDKIHGRFLIQGTVTGRTSSQEPNLQNIPRTTTSKLIKPMFTPPPGYIVMEVDYSQAELRVAAELAKETTMIEWFNNNYNIHVATACNANGGIDQYEEVKNVILKDPTHPDNELWEIRKKRAKLINFGILYGQTKWKLSLSLECTPDEAQVFLDNWFKDFPKIKNFINKMKRKAEKDGYVTSMWGRKRRLPDAQLKGDWEMRGYYQKALRDAVNAPIQGASNDFTLFSSVVIREEKIKGNLPWDMVFLASVHDALIFYIQPKDLKKYVPLIKEICNNPHTKEFFGFEMKHVYMKVSVEIGKTWGGKEDYVEDSQDYTKWLTDPDYPHHKDFMKNSALAIEQGK